MLELANNDKEVKTLFQKEKIENALSDFEGFNCEEEKQENLNWLGELETDSKGRNLQTINNVILIFSNDSNIKGKIAFNEFYNRIFLKSKVFWKSEDIETSWVDEDMSNLMNYIEKTYCIKQRKSY